VNGKSAAAQEIVPHIDDQQQVLECGSVGDRLHEMIISSLELGIEAHWRRIFQLVVAISPDMHA
jgi:hypothetical protein